MKTIVASLAVLLGIGALLYFRDSRAGRGAAGAGRAAGGGPTVIEGDNAPVPIRKTYPPAPLRLADPPDAGQLADVLKKFLPNRPVSSPSSLLHYIYLWGPDSEFSDPGCMSGARMIGCVFDGKADPLYTMREPLAFVNAVGEVRINSYGGGNAETHADQTLSAMADLGLRPGRRLRVRDGWATLRDALNASIANFVPDQELEWSLSCYARYLPPRRSWRNKWGDSYDFDRVAGLLLSRDLGEGACYGTHAMYALCVVLQVDDRHDIISDQTRGKIVARLKRVSELLEANQHPGGCWSYYWHKPDLGGFTWYPGDQTREMLLVTGHHLEWFKIAPPEVIPPESRVRKALGWCYRALAESGPAAVAGNPCPYSHGVKSLLVYCYPDLLQGGYLPCRLF